MHKSLACAAAALLASVSLAAVGQEVFVPPVTTASPGYLFPNDSHQRERHQDAAAKRQAELRERQQRAPVTGQPGGQSSAPATIELDAAARERIRAQLQRLTPEYHQRARRDGEASANDWIRQKAFELGQREADIMKKRLGME